MSAVVDQIMNLHRSMRGVRKRLNDSSIWRMPASRPLVQTFVARKSCLWSASSAARSPVTLSELPYIGDESMTLPPARANSRKTCLRGSRAAFPVADVESLPSAEADGWQSTLPFAGSAYELTNQPWRDLRLAPSRPR